MNKYIKYIIPVLAIGGIFYVYGENLSETEKIKSSHPVAAPAAQYAPAGAPMQLTGSDDGIPYGLHLIGIDNKEVSMRWNNPEPTNGYFDDFEGHPDFVINSPGSIGWEYLDMDNELTYTWSATSFPNQGQRMAFIVMNPFKTSPSVGDWPHYQPYSGNKMLATFTVDGGNNDFIISPELNFTENFQISFYAKSYSDVYGLERLKVGYSTTGKQASDFTFVTQSPYEEVPTDWTFYQYEIPKEAKYVTINCVSHEAFMMLIDDIFVGTNKIRPQAPAKTHIAGFNLYRNGIKANNEPITKVTYTDIVPDYGKHTYSVTSIYADGTETAQSEVLVVDVPDIRLLPFEDDFETYTISPEKWSFSDSESNWKADYYSYGLVDFSATFRYSSLLTNYSQSLITRELNTPDKENTYLRFELRLHNGENVGGDSLSVEVSCDNTNWSRVKGFCNDEGSYYWRVEEFCLADHLTSNLFRVRFRAHGIDGTYIDYWYVDDVKIWTPVWTTATLTIQNQGTALANCPVKLTADHGAIINTTSDANGKIEFPKIEAGNYTVSIIRDGYNDYTGSWEITPNGQNLFTAAVTRPILTQSETSVHANLKVEEIAKHSLTLRNTGDGEVSYILNPNYTAGSGDITNRWELQKTFDTSGDLQTSIAFDGEYYYTASWYFLGKYFKYDKDGNFIEEFSIPGMYYKLYDLAFDGTYFYGSDLSNVIYQLDFRNKRLIKEIIIKDAPDLEITHCSYDPRNDQFWVGEFYTLGRVDRDGNIVVDFRDITSDGSVAAYGSAFDNITPGGPYLWFGDEKASGTNIIDRTKITQYNLNTRKVTQVSFHLENLPGFQNGNDEIGPNYVCGVETSTAVVDGTLSLIGVLQQSPSRVFVYKLCDINTWLKFTPKTGILTGGAEQEIEIAIDARNGVVGETYTNDISIATIPQIEAPTLSVSYTVTGISEIPRPISLVAAIENDCNIILSWENGNAENTPTGYNIYRNGKKINETPITETEYTDSNLIRGNYTYNVSALYGDRESVLSDKVETNIKIGAPYYAPSGITASVSNNKQISLSWEAPDEVQKTETIKYWGSGENADAMGITEGGYFWVAVKWDSDDLANYRNMILDTVNVYIQEQYQSLALQIYKDEKRVVTQTIRSGIQFGKFNAIALNNPLTIEPGCDYIVSFLVAHDAGLRPIGIDNTKPINGKGNLMSVDGKEWFPATHQGLSGGNFNISIHLSPSITQETAPIGYNIYRNGTRVNETNITERNYIDEVTEPGIYSYQVTSLYDGNGESAPSETMQAEIIDLGTPYAPISVKSNVEYNRTIRLRWGFPMAEPSSLPVDLSTTHVTAIEGHPEFVNKFRGYIASEMAVASDGKHIYTSVYNANGTINKYTLDGEFIESFVVNNNLNGIRNITYDGKDFYASATDNYIYKLDMEQRCVSDTITISEIARHLTYIPDLDNGKGGFEIGDWTTSIYVTMQGAKIGNGPTYNGAAGTAYHNGILYAFEQGHEHPYVLCSYDFATGKKINEVDLHDYAEIAFVDRCSAGGMSLVTTDEGLTLLALTLQDPANSQFIFLDPGSIRGLAGYNIYRNGEKRNDQPVKFRYFTEEETVIGEYRYEIETVYIDGTVSPKSQVTTVEIYDSELCDAPTDVKARATSYGYNVAVSFVDPTLKRADTFASFEEATADAPYAQTNWINTDDTWMVTTQDAFDGKQSLISETNRSGWLIIPVEENEADFYFSFIARNNDDHNGKGEIKILASNGSANTGDFYTFATATTTEAWKRYEYVLPAGTKYVALRHEATTRAQYVDAIMLHTDAVGEIYGYDIMRDGKQLNTSPITDVSYIDHNLLPGTYNYQVRAYYVSSCVSEYSQAVTVDVDYSNNCQQPGQLSVIHTDEGRLLEWSAPALGDAIHLRWHNGEAHDAAGMPNGGAYFAGVQWSSDELTEYNSLSLTEVEFYINQIPDALFLLVYEGNTLVRQQYIPQMKQYSFNTVVLDSPLRINTDKTLRVVLYVEHNEISVPLGYDEGPAKAGKGDLYSSDGVNWSTLTANSIDGNWNISLSLQAYAEVETPVEESAPIAFAPKRTTTAHAAAPIKGVKLQQAQSSNLNTFGGYNVYCNSKLLNDTPLQATTYIDNETHRGNYYEYQVKAIYSGCGEVGSNVVVVQAQSGIEGIYTDDVRFYYADGNIVVEGLRAGTVIALFDATGKVIHTGISTDAPSYTIRATALASGVYVIHAGNKNSKILIK